MESFLKNVKIIAVFGILVALFSCSLTTNKVCNIPLNTTPLFEKARAGTGDSASDLTLIATLTDHTGTIQTKTVTDLANKEAVKNESIFFENILVGTVVNVDLKIKQSDGRVIYSANDNISIIDDITTVTLKFNSVALTPLPVEDFILVEGTIVANKIADSSVFTGSVTIDSFYMSKHEVTQAEYKKIMGSVPTTLTSAPNYPVGKVSWYDAIVYCNKRSVEDGLDPCYSLSINGKPETDTTKWGTVPQYSKSTWNAVVCDFTQNGYRLPTEAEWEYAARGGKNGIEKAQTKYAGSDSVSTVAWYEDNARSDANAVETKKANSLGIFDLSGNIAEWCWDKYDTGRSQVLRGGSYSSPSSKVTVSSRGNYHPYVRFSDAGFRVVCTKK